MPRGWTRTLTPLDQPWIDQWLGEEQIPPLAGLDAAVRAGQVTGAWYDGQFLGLGGWSDMIYPRVLHVYIVPALAVLDHPRYAVWVMRRLLRELEHTHQVRRFQTLAKKDWPEACRLIELLGFEAEGVMRELLPGQDYTMYARLACKEG